MHVSGRITFFILLFCSCRAKPKEPISLLDICDRIEGEMTAETGAEIIDFVSENPTTISEVEDCLGVMVAGSHGSFHYRINQDTSLFFYTDDLGLNDTVKESAMVSLSPPATDSTTGMEYRPAETIYSKEFMKKSKRPRFFGAE